MMAASFAGLLDQKTVIINGLHSTTTKEIIFETFKQYGCIKSINLDLAKGKALVNFDDGKSARRAQQVLNNNKICGATIFQIATDNGTTNNINYDCKLFQIGNCQKGKVRPYRNEVTSSDTVDHFNRITFPTRKRKNVDSAYPDPALENDNDRDCVKRAKLVPVVKPAPAFKEGMPVEIQINQKPHTGLLNKVGSGTDGTFYGQRFFTCSDGYSANSCKVDNSTIQVPASPKHNVNAQLGQLDTRAGKKPRELPDGSNTKANLVSQQSTNWEKAVDSHGRNDTNKTTTWQRTRMDGSGLTAKKDQAPTPQPYLCYHFLKNSCTAGEKCYYIHLPHLSTYAWCYKSKSEEDFKLCKIFNDEIEKAFSDPDCDQFKNEGSLLVNFNNLDASKYNFKEVSFVRYSTESHVLIPKEEKATKWKWYWLDNDKKWNEYQVAQSATSDMIEKVYLEWMKSGHPNYFHFVTASFYYVLNFSTMMQRNKDPYLKTKRLVRRRPVYIVNKNEGSSLVNFNNLDASKYNFKEPTIGLIKKEFDEWKKKIQRLVRRRSLNATGIRDISQINVESFISLPPHWPVTLSGKEYQLLSIDGSTMSEIRRKFEVTMTSFYEIVSIKEVCNKEFFNKYTSKKKAMKETCKNINELQLWHGTSHTNIEHICHQNFDCRMCITGDFGQGCYFARDARYSHTYSDMNHNNIYSMFLADVLVGEYTMGNYSYKRPPEKEKFKLYDSCVDNTANPSIYVIFERDQCYPRYLLQYKGK